MGGDPKNFKTPQQNEKEQEAIRRVMTPKRDTPLSAQPQALYDAEHLVAQAARVCEARGHGGLWPSPENCIVCQLAKKLARVVALCNEPSDAMVEATLRVLESGAFREKDDQASMRAALRAALATLLTQVEAEK